jgi:fructose-1,6-bisphosphatase/inositol monophosphatase family enzyme
MESDMVDSNGVPLGASGRTAAEVAKAVALKAGDMLLDRFHKAKRVSFKGRGNIVTDVDTAVETEIRSVLQWEFPQMGFLGEESPGDRAGAGYVWIVDPLDGTRNYASQIPFYSTVVGLALDGQSLVGVNLDPEREEMFFAEKGKGAFLNDQPIRMSEKSAIEDCIVGMDLSYGSEGAANSLDVVRSIWPGMQTARIMGSAALGISYAAAGRTDLYFHHRLEPWDQVAGMILVEEAGGVITDRAGRRAGLYSDGLIATNATLHAEFMRTTEGMAWRNPTERSG